MCLRPLSLFPFSLLLLAACSNEGTGSNGTEVSASPSETGGPPTGSQTSGPSSATGPGPSQPQTSTGPTGPSGPTGPTGPSGGAGTAAGGASAPDPTMSGPSGAGAPPMETGGNGNGGSPTGGSTSPPGGANGDAGTTVGGGAGSGGAGGAGPVVPECVVPDTGPVTDLITFNDDGGWCWYQDERVIVDTEANRMVIASVATGGQRNGNIEVTFYDLDGGGSPQRSMLGDLNPDDHNVAALTQLGPEHYLAIYTTHNDDCYSYFNIYQNGSWGQQQRFDWAPHGCPTPTNRTVSYSNIWRMGDQIFNYVRSVETSPNLMVSSNGSSWQYGGRLSSTPTVGYVSGYYKYWGNNVDRIDFVGTEAHPRDNDNSLYHGYIKDGKSFNSFDEVVDDDIHDGSAPNINEFTPVFRTGSNLGSARLIHMWNHDLMRYDDGTIVLTFQGRANGDTNDPDKRFGYARFDGSDWKTTYLVKGGSKLYDSEQDYTGLSAIHPNDPYTIYISTPIDPRDDTTNTGTHEIWRGTTCDEGETFTWTPITENSSEDQLRPVVPYWESDRTALLWMSGNYASAQTYSASIVGVILDGR